MALALLADDRLDALITDEVAFEDLPRALPRLLAPGAPRPRHRDAATDRD